MHILHIPTEHLLCGLGLFSDSTKRRSSHRSTKKRITSCLLYIYKLYLIEQFTLQLANSSDNSCRHPFNQPGLLHVCDHFIGLLIVCEKAIDRKDQYWNQSVHDYFHNHELIGFAGLQQFWKLTIAHCSPMLGCCSGVGFDNHIENEGKILAKK